MLSLAPWQRLLVGRCVKRARSMAVSWSQLEPNTEKVSEWALERSTSCRLVSSPFGRLVVDVDVDVVAWLQFEWPSPEQALA